MKRMLFVTAVVLALIVLAVGSVQAGFKGPKVTGGGQAQNNNSGLGVDLISIGGFNAQATGPADAGEYPAKGQVQAKNVLASDPSTTIAQVHGSVVCMFEKRSGVWEIRFKITKSRDANGNRVTTGVAAEGTYASAFVQDNGPGTSDKVDENFAPSAKDNESCGQDLGFGLEPLLAGNIKDH